MKIPRLQCDNPTCGNCWTPRIENPKYCPRCKGRKWHVVKKKK